MKNYLLLGAALAFGLTTLPAAAQQVTVSPLPQNITWGEGKAFDNTTTFTLVGADEADADAVTLLKESLTTGEGGVELVIGERGDEAVAEYEANIPEHEQGYYLSVDADRVVIAGNDVTGTYYGVQTFLQVASQPEVQSVTVTDYPLVLERGVIEGFYGNPWSETDRIRQFEFYGQNKMNVYIYGPKDDPYHRNQWRKPYPAAEAAGLQRLIEAAHKNKVQFVWALHPGLDIQWNDTDRQNVIDKLESVYKLGCRRFALFFDDISGNGGNPAEQANLLNYVTENFIHKHDLEPLIMCPTEYNRGWVSGNGEYLTTLGSNTDPEVLIMWTGNSVVDMIQKADLDYINPRLERNAFIWLNYPVSDYCTEHLLMGKTYGNDLNIAGQLGGFASNPMEYAEASKVSLYSIADYTWNMTQYDAEASWERAIKALWPGHAEAFKTFCESNVDLGTTTHGLRREGETPDFVEPANAFEESIDKGYDAGKAAAVKAVFTKMVAAADELLASDDQPEMLKEIKPWLQVMKLQAQRGEKLIDLFARIDAKDPDGFITLYKEMQELETEQKSIRSRDFEGSIKNPNPTVASNYVEPFLASVTGRAIAEYKAHFDEHWDVFPAVVLEDGSYYIKSGDRFLTNNNPGQLGGYPTFTATADNINPQKQEWNISMDYTTNRYKVTNAQDNRYLNENGAFAASNEINPYEAVWHTYVVYRLNGKYAIQNAGNSGKKFWTVNGNRIQQGSNNEWSTGSLVFDLVPLSGEVKHPMFEDGKEVYITYNGKYLTNNNVGGSGQTPTFKGRLANDTRKTQQWKLTVDSETGRYKLTSAADNRYVNELGAFGTNAYDATWNTYVISEVGGLYSIQNAGESGTEYWTVEDDRITDAGSNRDESFIFGIEPVNPSTSGIDGVTADKGVLKYQIGEETITVSGRDGIRDVQLVAANGLTVASSRGVSSVSTAGLPTGAYVLVVKGNGWQESAKVAL